MKHEKADIINSNLSPKGIFKAKLWFPITYILLYVINLLSGESIKHLNDKVVITPKKRPIIYACTHKFKPDMEKITLSIKKPSFLLASDFINSYGTISGWYLNTRPAIFVEPYDKYDKSLSYKLMVKYLKKGFSCMIFPEAVWNLSENRIVLGTFSGTIRAAIESNAVVVCTAIERYGKKYVINRNGYLDFVEIVKKNMGCEFFQLSKDKQLHTIKECNSILRDTMATLTMEIWMDYAKCYGVERRSKLSNNYWNDFVNSLITEWEGYKLSDNIEQQYYINDQLVQQEVKKILEKIEPSLNNAFLFSKRNHN